MYNTRDLMLQTDQVPSPAMQATNPIPQNILLLPEIWSYIAKKNDLQTNQNLSLTSSFVRSSVRSYYQQQKRMIFIWDQINERLGPNGGIVIGSEFLNIINFQLNNNKCTQARELVSKFKGILQKPKSKEENWIEQAYERIIIYFLKNNLHAEADEVLDEVLNYFEDKPYKIWFIRGLIKTFLDYKCHQTVKNLIAKIEPIDDRCERSLELAKSQISQGLYIDARATLQQTADWIETIPSDFQTSSNFDRYWGFIKKWPQCKIKTECFILMETAKLQIQCMDDQGAERNVLKAKEIALRMLHSPTLAYIGEYFLHNDSREEGFKLLEKAKVQAFRKEYESEFSSTTLFLNISDLYVKFGDEQLFQTTLLQSIPVCDTASDIWIYLSTFENIFELLQRYKINPEILLQILNRVEELIIHVRGLNKGRRDDRTKQINEALSKLVYLKIDNLLFDEAKKTAKSITAPQVQSKCLIEIANALIQKGFNAQSERLYREAIAIWKNDIKHQGFALLTDGKLFDSIRFDLGNDHLVGEILKLDYGQCSRTVEQHNEILDQLIRAYLKVGNLQKAMDFIKSSYKAYEVTPHLINSWMRIADYIWDHSSWKERDSRSESVAKALALLDSAKTAVYAPAFGGWREHWLELISKAQAKMCDWAAAQRTLVEMLRHEENKFKEKGGSGYQFAKIAEWLAAIYDFEGAFNAANIAKQYPNYYLRALIAIGNLNFVKKQ